LYDVLDTSFGARQEPLFITISTQSNDPEHILSKLIDDGLSGVDPSIVCHLFAADEDCELDDQAQWLKANPALGKFRDKEDLVTAIAKAKRMPAEEPKVRNLFLNQRVSPDSPLIARATWMECRGEVAFTPGEEIYLGLDLASTVDLSALIMASATEPVRVQPFFWKPQDNLIEHSARDFGTGNHRYVQWVEEGFLRTCAGRALNPAVIALCIADISQRYRVRGLAYDRWRADELLREFDHIGLRAYRDEESKKNHDGLRVVPWGQGFRDMGPAIDALEGAIVDRKLVHPNHPILNWNLANAIATMDPAGNRKLDKDKARFRIDGAVALAMALGLRARDRAPKKVDIETLIA
jgi:phage terminase large subunit-like protein